MAQSSAMPELEDDSEGHRGKRNADEVREVPDVAVLVPFASNGYLRGQPTAEYLCPQEADDSKRIRMRGDTRDASDDHGRGQSPHVTLRVAYYARHGVLGDLLRGLRHSENTCISIFLK